ncbi:MAG: NADP-dependent phosphogluconate dehydrogenase [Bacteroidetes bacterium]|nr:NADP-dependent phosphogluconate dehydrogenase [Bacteroidota bacterium]
MAATTFDFGMIGLGTMGQNLSYNMADHGFSVAGYDKNPAKVAAFGKEADTGAVAGFGDIKEFIGALKSPKVIMMLVPAGPIVDAVINDVKPFLQSGDLLLDCGNSHFTDTDRRLQALEQEGLLYMGIGVSGGEEGARFGPSIMPGGSKKSYALVEKMLAAVAAKVNGEPCVAWLGNGSAGHYVKMVHNGIEYAIMQVIAESYHLLRTAQGLDNAALHRVYQDWNQGRLQSYLMQITADIFTQKDELGEGQLLDKIVDESAQNGTGKWTSQSAMDLFVPLSPIDTAVCSRDISSLKAEREQLAKNYAWAPPASQVAQEKFVADLEQAVYATSILAYSVGFSLLAKASSQYKLDLNLAVVARIWRGGCIIRSSFLEEIMKAFDTDPDLSSLLFDTQIATLINGAQLGWRSSVKAAVDAGVAVPVLSASLSYFDAMRCGRLPANLIQAQRDFFGAHTYKRTDREGIFHTNWPSTI